MADPRPIFSAASSLERPPARRRSAVVGLALAALLGGCAVGPNYRRPAVETPAAFREAPPGWKQATPNDALNRGAWWAAFGDPTLDALEPQVATANQSLIEAASNYEQERQLARAEGAAFWPTVSIDGSASRDQGTSHGGISSASSTASGSAVIVSTTAAPVNAYVASGAATWDLDLWGRVRRLIEADVETAQADAALLASTRLSLQSDLAQDYIQLRVLDARRRLLDDATADYERTLEIARNKYNAGVSSRSDVLSAQAQLDATRAQAVDAGVQRATLEHAIAVLVGKAPSDLRLPARAELGIAMPGVPAAIPSELLERRPDIAEAERDAAAANARVGEQIAAYFPTLSLSASGGFQGSDLAKLFELPNRVWSLGGSAGELLFSAGARGDQVRAARAAYNSAVASYRQTVLSAFEQVEDELSTLRLVGQEAQIQQTAVNEAAQASRIALNEYQAGTVDYTTVVTAQVTELTDRESLLNLQQEQLTASVVLIQALGGGWTSDDLPGWHRVMKKHPSGNPAEASSPASG